MLMYVVHSLTYGGVCALWAVRATLSDGQTCFFTMLLETSLCFHSLNTTCSAKVGLFVVGEIFFSLFSLKITDQPSLLLIF
jgi:hypothetical protein